MTRWFGIATAVVIGTLTWTDGSAWGGAKEGKVRWSHRKTGQGTWYPPLIVPAAKSAKEPGRLALKIEYKGGELAQFFCIGDGDTDLDLVVLDSQGREVARDIDLPEEGSDMCVCRWVPRRNEVFTVIILNHGTVENVVSAGCN